MCAIIKEVNMNHEFRMYVGPMFGGKTTRMLSQAERYTYQGEDLILFKPRIDERYDSKSIVTHTGIKSKAHAVVSGDQIERMVSALLGSDPCVIAVDEAFMIKGSGQSLVNLFKLGHTILVSSLQLSSDSTPYEEIQAMFPYATHVEVCPAVDPVSKKDAYYTEKYGGRKDHGIEVGGADIYRPRDWSGFFGGN